MEKRGRKAGFMIGLLCCGMAMAGMFYLAGYQAACDRTEASGPAPLPQTFYATISDMQDNIFTVTGMEVNDINYRGTFFFSIPEEAEITWRYADIAVEELEVGDHIAITFTGGSWSHPRRESAGLYGSNCWMTRNELPLRSGGIAGSAGACFFLLSSGRDGGRCGVHSCQRQPR